MAGDAIYMVLVKAHTGLGCVARSITRYPYTHVAVCMDETLTEFITFSRRRHYAPMDAGFMRETRSCYAFGSHKDFGAKVFRVPVTCREKRRMLAYIDRIEGDKAYQFNVLSMATMPLLHGVPIGGTHNCMSFTAKILSMAGAVTLEKPYYRYNIREMDELLTPWLLFEGRIKKRGQQPPGYMDRVPVTRQAAIGLRLAGTLAARLLFPAGK